MPRSTTGQGTHGDAAAPPALHSSLTAQGHEAVCPATLPTVNPPDPMALKGACLAEAAPPAPPGPRAGLGPVRGACKHGQCHLGLGTGIQCGQKDSRDPSFKDLELDCEPETLRVATAWPCVRPATPSPSPTWAQGAGPAAKTGLGPKE